MITLDPVQLDFLCEASHIEELPRGAGRAGAEHRLGAPARPGCSARSSLRGGQLAANSCDQVSGRLRSPMLAWFDTATGRYFGQVTKALDGRDWTTFAPADAATLRKRLSEMMACVTD